MAPTPQSLEAGSEDRTRRNVACVNCRNSKVRCKAGQAAGEPCQRCAKLDMNCVVDKSHKRVTRRSKLELLEQELQSIKKAVHPKPDVPSVAGVAWARRSPRAAVPTTPAHTAAAHTDKPEEQSPMPVEPPGAWSLSTDCSGSNRPPPPPPPSGQDAGRRTKTGPTEARALGSLVISGEDIDWYFIKFLQCYHPYIPIVRKKDPDECFEANATLFWVIVCVASRRYPRDGDVFAAVADYVAREVWVMMSAPALGLEAVHALLLLCMWPLPGIRFTLDPSSTFAAVAINAAKLLGCHVGRGANPHFAVGLRQHLRSSDEEASSTWLACCMLMQRSASSMGIPTPSIQLADDGPKRALRSHRWTDLLAVYEAQRFLSRFHAAMAAQLGDGVPEAVVAMWEADFEALRPLLVRFDTDISRFCLIAAQLEIQTHYFIDPVAPSSSATPPSTQADTPPPSLRRNTARAVATSRTLLALALTLESRAQLLTHAPQWVLRSVVDASAILVAVLAHPSWAPLAEDAAAGRDDDDDGSVVRQACAFMLRCSVRDADLPHRLSVLMETFWAVRHLVPPAPHSPALSAWPDRLGAGVTLWCMERFRLGLRAAQSSTDRVNRALDLLQPNRLNASSGNDGGEPPRFPPADPASSGAETGPSAGAGADDSLQQAAVPPGSDPFLDVDWSMFMDEFGWNGEDAVLLGLP